MKNLLGKIAILSLVATTLLYTGCGGGGSDSSATSDTGSFSGVAVDGYISGATACLDMNLNSTCDSDEPTTITGTDGTFAFSNIELPEGQYLPVLVSGGTDIATNKPFKGEMKNIFDTTDMERTYNVTPLTDLIASNFMTSTDKNTTGLTAAIADISSALGLTAENIIADPMKDKKVFAKAQEIQQLKELILTSALKTTGLAEDSVGAAALQKNISLAIANSMKDDNTQLNTSSIINKLQTINPDVIIPANEVTFISTQITDIANSLEVLANDSTIFVDDLGNQQLALESVVEVASQNIADATTDSTIEVVGIILSATAVEDQVTNINYLGVLGGQMVDIVNVGDYAYSAQGRAGFKIYDTKDKKNPKLISSINTDGIASGVAVDGNFAYIADHKNGLVIIDITNKEFPQIVGTYNTDGYALKVIIQENLAYIADGSNGLVIIDITDRENPTLKGSYNTTGIVGDMVIRGNYAYLANEDNGINYEGAGFIILNITDKANPTLESQIETDGSTQRISIKDNYAYLTGGPTIIVLDITSANNPTLVRVVEGLNTYNDTSITIKDNFAYIGSGDILDISDPSNPSFIKNDTNLLSNEIKFDGNYAYLVATFGNVVDLGLVVLSINGTEIIQEGYYRGTGEITNFVVDGSYLYAMHGWRHSMSIYNIENKNNPFLVSHYDSNDSINDVKISGDGNFSYIIEENNGLSILNISDKSQPTLVSTVRVSEIGEAYPSGNKLVIDGTFAYIAANDFVIVNISDAGNPFIVSRYPAGGTGIVVENNYAYVAGAGVKIFDITNKESIVLKSTSPSITDSDGFGITLNDLKIDSNFIYVTGTSFNGLQVTDFVIYNIENKSSPLLTGRYTTSLSHSRLSNLAVNGDIAYLGDDGNNLQTIDLRDRANPSMLSSSTAGGFKLYGGYAYMFDYDSINIALISHNIQ